MKKIDVRGKVVGFLILAMVFLLAASVAFEFLPSKTADAARSEMWVYVGEIYDDANHCFYEDKVLELYKAFVGAHDVQLGLGAFDEAAVTACSYHFRSKNPPAKNVQVTFGGIKWNAVYIVAAQNEGGSTKKGDIILDLWQDATTVTQKSKWADRNTAADNPYETYPDNMYSTSYIRVVTLNAGGKYSTSGSTLVAKEIEQDPSNPYARFTMSGQDSNGRDSLIQYIATPYEVGYQADEFHSATATAFNGSNFYAPNDAYGTPSGGAWQSNDPVGGVQKVNYDYGSRSDLYDDWKDDYLWLPSITETGCDGANVNGGTGLWGTDESLRSAKTEGTWLRSGDDNWAANAYALETTGKNQHYYVHEQKLVRPAIHLNLSAINATLADTITAEWTPSKTFCATGEDLFEDVKADIINNIKFTNAKDGSTILRDSVNFTVTEDKNDPITDVGTHTVTLKLQTSKYQFARNGKITMQLTVDVQNAVATVTVDGNTTGYGTFDKALEAADYAISGGAKENVTLKMFEDATYIGTITSPGDIDFTLDLNNNRLTFTADGGWHIMHCENSAWFTLTDTSSESNGVYNGNVTVKDGNFMINKSCDMVGNVTEESASDFTMCDTCTLTGNVTVTRSFTLQDNATIKGGVYVNGGAFTMTGGTITNPNGSGVEIKDLGTFRMSGGTITKCHATQGAGVACESGNMLIISGNAKITDNIATGDGGGIYVMDPELFNIDGGTISGNQAANGGGIYMEGGTLNLNGGSITNNKATGDGNGVYVTDYAQLTMKNGAVTGTAADGEEDVYVMAKSTYGGDFKWSGGDIGVVYLENGAYIEVQASFAQPSYPISIAVNYAAIGETPVKVLSWAGTDPFEHFKSADDKACFYKHIGNTAYIGKHVLLLAPDATRWTGHESVEFMRITCSNCEKSSSATTHSVNKGATKDETCMTDGSQEYSATLSPENMESDVFDKDHSYFSLPADPRWTATTAEPIPHKGHIWEYEVTDNTDLTATVTAKCANPKHDKSGAESEDGAPSFTVTFQVPSGAVGGGKAVYNGAAQPATLSGETDKFPGVRSIAYKFNKENPENYAGIGGEPKDAGFYQAVFTASYENDPSTPKSNIEVTLQFQIEKATLTVTANEHGITYGDEQFGDSGVSYGAFQGTDNATAVKGEAEFEYSYERYGNVNGNYTITPKQGTLSADNYKFEFVSAKLTVNPKPITVKFDQPHSLVYGNIDGAFSADLIGVEQPYGSLDDVHAVLTYSGNANDGTSASGANMPLKAGSYQVSATIDGVKKDNYELTGSTAQSFDIQRAAITVSGKYEAQREYNGEVYKQTISTAGEHNGLTVDMSTADPNFEFTISTAADAETYSGEIEIEKYDKNNFTLTGKVSYTVKIIPKTVATEWADLSVIYSGVSQTPKAIAQTGIGGEKITLSVILQNGDTGVLTKGAAVNVGAYKATAQIAGAEGTKTGNYALEGDTADFNITRAELVITWVGPYSYVYGSSPTIPTATANFKENDGERTSVSVAEKDGNIFKNAGDYTFEATLVGAAQGNYDIAPGSKEHVYSITRAHLAAQLSASVVYGDDFANDNVVVTISAGIQYGENGEELAQKVKEKVTKFATTYDKDKTHVGDLATVSYAATVELNNYTVSFAEGAVDVAQRSIKLTLGNNMFNTYGDGEHGKIAASATRSDKEDLKWYGHAEDEDKLNAELEYKFKKDGAAEAKGYEPRMAAGDYTVLAVWTVGSSLAKDYKIDGEPENNGYEVKKKEITITMTATVEYGEATPQVTFTKGEGIVSGDVVEEILSAAKAAASFAYGGYGVDTPVSQSNKLFVTSSNGTLDNYIVKYEKCQLEITKRKIKVTLTFKPTTYGKDPQAEGWVEAIPMRADGRSGDWNAPNDLGGVALLDITYQLNGNLGEPTYKTAAATYSVTPTCGNGNYDVEFADAKGGKDFVYTVNKATLNVRLSATVEYGEQTPKVSLFYVSGLVDGDDESAITAEAYAAASFDFGSYTKSTEVAMTNTIDVTSADGTLDNYVVKYEKCQLEITKRKIEVTLTFKSTTYGDDPEQKNWAQAQASRLGNGSWYAEADGDNIEKLALSYTLNGIGTAPTKRTGAGVYDVAPHCGNGNYDVDFVDIKGGKDFKYTVEKAVLTVKANDNEIVYGNAPQENGVTFYGFMNDDDQSVVGGKENIAFTYDYSRYDDVKDGSFAITPNVSKLTADNYDFAAADGTLTVKQKAITVKIKLPEALTYGNIGDFAAEFADVEDLDKEFVKAVWQFDGTPNDNSDFSHSDKKPTLAGTYTVKVVGLDGTKAANYALSNDGEQRFTVKRATVAKPAEDETLFIYTGNWQTYNVQGGDADLFSVTGNVQKDANEDGYTVTVFLDDKNNYMWQSEGDEDDADLKFVFVILKKTLASPTVDSKVYNGSTQTAQVPSSDLYVVTENNGGIIVGDYDVKLTLADDGNYRWANSETAVLTLTFAITKADYDMSDVTFEGLTLTYDANEHSIFISGQLPKGVSVTYDGNGQKAVGIHTVTAIFAGDEHNYNDIPSKEATLTILQVSHDLSGIRFDDVTVKYDGNAHDIVIDGELPTNVTVTYEGNGQIDPNIYSVIAIFSDPDGEFDRRTATLTVLRTHTEVEISEQSGAEVAIESEEGFDPTWELVVEKIEDVERTYWAWGKDLVSKKFVVKMCKDGVEVPIDGKVTVRLLIPEEFRNKDFELKTMARAASVEYIRDGDYVVFEADALSVYVFTSTYTSYFSAIIIATSVLFADVLILIALMIVIKKKRKLR